MMLSLDFSKNTDDDIDSTNLFRIISLSYLRYNIHNINIFNIRVGGRIAIFYIRLLKVALTCMAMVPAL